MNEFKHIRKEKITGICDVNEKWVRIQYKDQWDDNCSYDMPTEDWREMGKPFLGDYIRFEVTTHEG